MKITNEFIEKLRSGGEFNHEGETYECFRYGGIGRNSWKYLKSEASSKMIKIEYSLRKVGEDEYVGIEVIKRVVWWKDYNKGGVIDTWNWLL